MLEIEHIVTRLKRRKGVSVDFSALWSGMPRDTTRTALAKALRAHPNVEQVGATKFRYKVTEG